MKYEERTVRVVSYREFNRVCTETFVKEYDCIAENEWSNDSQHELKPTGTHFNPETKEYDPGLSDYEREDFEKWLKGEKIEGNGYSYYPSLDAHTAAEILVDRGVIEPGTYIIDAWW